MSLFNFFYRRLRAYHTIQAVQTSGSTASIPLRYINTDFVNALKISKQVNMYAYDGYFLDCAIRHKAPLLTLDRKLKTAAQKLNVETMEV